MPLASAVETADTQKDITVSVERGGEYTFHLILRNIAEPVMLSSSGDASSWVTFGEDGSDSYSITNLVNQSIKVSIFVPSSAEIKQYDAKINAGDSVISDITVDVSRPVSDVLDEISSRISSMSDELSNLKSGQNNLETNTNKLISKSQTIMDIQEDLRNMSENVEDKISELSDYQRNIHELETQFKAEKENLLERITELENQTKELAVKNEKMTELTGQMTFSYSSVSFSLGLIAGVFLVVFYSKGGSFSKPLRRIRAPKLRLHLNLKGKMEKMNLKLKKDKKKYKYKFNSGSS
jgi:uncharacterized phage infection (PIP) family protein YhgE